MYAPIFKKVVQDNLLDEQVEDDDDDDDDDRSSVVLQYASQHPNLTSIHDRNVNASFSHSRNSSISPLESSTSSLMAHQRHLHRTHQQQRRRQRSVKASSKLILANNIDETKQPSNKVIERQRFNYARTPKIILHQPSRSNH
ncbi:unnamed protein product [Rotaria socialis]|uniref:Uncharacterized protein n=1 Tax=Rotaria socialis TaxID=392032 RepID=A0A820P7A6_9BILA|nr:unnamed protein product [Rotaria socialis]